MNIKLTILQKSVGAIFAPAKIMDIEKEEEDVQINEKRYKDKYNNNPIKCR